MIKVGTWNRRLETMGTVPGLSVVHRLTASRRRRRVARPRRRLRLAVKRRWHPRGRICSRLAIPQAFGSALASLPVGLVLLVMSLLHVATAPAQDIVTTLSESGKTAKRRGEIVEWKGSSLTLKSDSRTSEIDNARIVKVETSWSADYAAGQNLIGQRKFQDAIASLRQALAAEQRDWAKNIIRIELVKAYSAVEQDFAAVEEFALIVASDPQTRFMDMIPLAWAGTVGGADVKNYTENWFAANEPVLQLIAASWHLGSPKRATAIQVLKQLSNDIDPQIANLAVTQLWRTELTSVESSQLEKWNQRIEQMPKELRAGPYFVLGSAQAQLKLTDEAAINLMRVPILYSEQRNLAAASLYKCGNLLHNEQRTDEAKKVWKELLSEYPDTVWSSQVDVSLLQSPSD